MPGHGQQRDFLPQAYSDFIYAIIIEELGMTLGVSLCTVALYNVASAGWDDRPEM